MSEASRGKKVGSGPMPGGQARLLAVVRVPDRAQVSTSRTCPRRARWRRPTPYSVLQLPYDQDAAVATRSRGPAIVQRLRPLPQAARCCATALAQDGCDQEEEPRQRCSARRCARTRFVGGGSGNANIAPAGGANGTAKNGTGSGNAGSGQGSGRAGQTRTCRSRASGRATSRSPGADTACLVARQHGARKLRQVEKRQRK